MLIRPMDNFMFRDEKGVESELYPTYYVGGFTTFHISVKTGGGYAGVSSLCLYKNEIDRVITRFRSMILSPGIDCALEDYDGMTK